MTVAVAILDADAVEACIGPLSDLLVDVVDAGASLGFWAPLAASRAQSYWREIAAAARAGHSIVFVARAAGAVVGSIQLAPATRDNSQHRAEVQKLIVHTAHRRRGIARQLLAAAHAEAKRRRRTLLVLDTRTGDPAESLYASMGYTKIGIIPGYVIETDGSSNPTSVFYCHLP